MQQVERPKTNSALSLRHSQWLCFAFLVDCDQFAVNDHALCLELADRFARLGIPQRPPIGREERYLPAFFDSNRSAAIVFHLVKELVAPWQSANGFIAHRHDEPRPSYPMSLVHEVPLPDKTSPGNVARE